MIYVTVPGLEDKVREQAPDCTDVVILKPNRPMMPQLDVIQDLHDVIVTPHPDWQEDERTRFILSVHEALMSLQITRNTWNKYNAHWEENSFQNHEWSISSPGIEEITKRVDVALVCGSGPSVSEITNTESIETFVPWSALKRIKFIPNYVGHCDHRGQDFTLATKHNIIFTPVCSPSFLERHRHQDKYVYYDRGNYYCWRISKKLNLPDHPIIVGNAVDMLLNTVLLIGYKVILLAGVDFSFKTREKLLEYRDCEDVIEGLNYNGERVYLDAVFLLYKRALENLVSRWPDVSFRTLSPAGVILEGVPYDPFGT